MEKLPQNMVLDRPRLLAAEISPAQRWAFFGALLVLGGLGSWGCFITAFGLEVMPAALVAAGLLCCGFQLWRQVDTRKRWWSVSLVGWIVWLLAGVIFFDQVFHGAVRTVNAMMDQYSIKLNFDLPMLVLSYPPSQPRPQPEKEYTAFFCLLFYPFFWAMSRLLVRRRSALGAFCLSGFLLTCPLSFSIIPKLWALGALLMFWCALLLVTPLLGLDSRWRRQLSGSASARLGTLLILFPLLACMLAVYWAIPPETYTRPDLVDQLRVLVEESVRKQTYVPGGQGNSNRQVYLNGMGSRSYTGETVLRVKFEWDIYNPFEENDQWWESRFYTFTNLEKSPKQYLKSFVGSVYTGQSWERLDQDALAELSGLELTPQNQIAQYQQKLFLSDLDASSRFTLEVQNLGANPRCVFTPYGLSDSEEELEAMDMVLADDGFVKSANFLSGTRNYTLHAADAPVGVNYFMRVADRIVMEETGVLQDRYLGFADRGRAETNPYEFYNALYPYEWPSLYQSLVSQRGENDGGWVEDLWKMPEETGTWYTEEQREFLSQVEDYNDFVYRHYTQVPENLREYLDSYRESLGLDPYTLERDFSYRDGPKYFAWRIAEVFRQYYTYSLNPPSPANGQDFVEFFLEESREGYCVHFASAAVLLLRSAGYPARYAEGYAVPGSTAGWVDVPDYNAHAWVEVYCGGTGWVPVEVTPASADNPSVYYDATIPVESPSQSSQALDPQARPTLPPRTGRPMNAEELEAPTLDPRFGSSPAPSPGAPGGYRPEEDPSFWPTVLGIVGALGAAVLCVMLNRSLRKRNWEKGVSQEDRNQAALKAYALLLKLYEWEALCGRREEAPERWKELAEKARFGRGMVSQAELAELTEAADQLREKLRRQLPRLQKAKCWLTGLI